EDDPGFRTLLVVVKENLTLERGDVPELHPVEPTACGEVLAVGAERGRRPLIRKRFGAEPLILHRGGIAAAWHVPKLDRATTADGGEGLAIRAEAHRLDALDVENGPWPGLLC